MQASLIVFPIGKKIFWQGYHVESDGGSNWGLVQAGVGINDGGSEFTLADGQHVEANLKGNKVSIRKFGGRSDNVIGTSDAVETILSLGYPIYIPQGVFRMDRPLSIPSGAVITGDGSEAYGEQQHKTPSLLSFIGLAAGVWCVEFASGVRGVRFENWGIEGEDWTQNGVDFVEFNREVDFIDFSIQRVDDGMQSDDAWVMVFDRLSVTCAGTGIRWGAGTTIDFRQVKLSGFKPGNVLDRKRMKKGFHFVSGFKLQNTIISGFCQFCEDAIYIEGSPTLDIIGFDWEDNSVSCITLSNTDELRLSIDSSSALLSDASSFINVIGTINGATKVYIKNLGGKTKHFSSEFNGSLDWSTEFFVKDAGGASFSNEAIIEVREDFYNTIKDGIEPIMVNTVHKCVQGDKDWQTKATSLTPTVYGSTVAGSGSYSVRVANQYRVGNLINFSVDVSWSGHTGTGDLMISGLLSNAAWLNSFSDMFTNIDAAGEFISGRLFPGGKDLDFYITKNNTFGSKVQMDAEGQITVSGSYVVE
jgi:hypothetical protein